MDKFAGGGGGAESVGRRAPADATTQDRVFRAQLALARELGRPATVHCVKAVRRVQDAVAAERPPKIAFHAFGGSPESASELTRTVEAYGGVAYFGFTEAHPTKHTRALLEALPAERILVESDSSESAAPLGAMTSTIAEAKGWTVDEATRALDGNADAFLPRRPVVQNPFYDRPGFGGDDALRCICQNPDEPLYPDGHLDDDDEWR